MGPHPRSWEPEPLELPADPPARKNRSTEERDEEENDRDRDLGGSHVVVIDVS